MAAIGRMRSPSLASLFHAAAFAEEQDGLGFDGAEQVHDRRGAGAAHAEIDDGDAAGRRVGHRTILAAHFGTLMPLGEHVDVIAEIDEEDVFAELVDGRAGVARQPVGDDFRFGSHTFPESNSRERGLTDGVLDRGQRDTVLLAESFDFFAVE